MTDDIPVHPFDSAFRKVGRSVGESVVAGTGFFLTFGWVWFPAVFSSLADAYPTAFSGTLMAGKGITAFSISLVTGLAIVAGMARYIPPRGSSTVILVHGGALILVGMAGFTASSSPLASSILWGVSGTGPAVWWGARILRLPAPFTGTALAVATLLAWIFTALKTTPTGAGWIAGGMVVAMALAVIVDGRKTVDTEFADTASTNRLTKSRDIGVVLPLVLVGYSLFVLGVMAPAFVMSYSTDLSARTLGVGMSIPVVSVLLGNPRRRAAIAVTVALAAAMVLLIFPNGTWIHAVSGGVVEGIAVAGMAVAPGASPAAGFSRAANGLAALFLLVNTGGAIGAGITAAGDLGLWLFAVIISGLSVPMYMIASTRGKASRRRKDAAQPGRTGGSAPTSRESSEPVPTPWVGLTRRECAVAELLTLDMTNPEICAALDVSDNTIRTHIKNIYRKTGAASRAELKTLLRESTRNQRPEQATLAIAAKNRRAD